MMISYKYPHSRHLFGDFFRNFYATLLLRKSKHKMKKNDSSCLPQSEYDCGFKCELCLSSCPSRCIDKKDDVVSINVTACLECGLCFESCPHKIILPKKS